MVSLAEHERFRKTYLKFEALLFQVLPALGLAEGMPETNKQKDQDVAMHCLKILILHFLFEYWY